MTGTTSQGLSPDLHPHFASGRAKPESQSTGTSVGVTWHNGLTSLSRHCPHTQLATGVGYELREKLSWAGLLDWALELVHVAPSDTCDGVVPIFGSTPLSRPARYRGLFPLALLVLGVHPTVVRPPNDDWTRTDHISDNNDPSNAVDRTRTPWRETVSLISPSPTSKGDLS